MCLSKDYENAAAEFETAIKGNAKLFEAYYFYARCCVAQGKMEKAAQLFEQACLVKPDDYQARHFLAQTYRALGLVAGAEAAYQKAVEKFESHLERHPEDPRAYQLGATALLELGEREKGVEWAKKAAALDPTNPTLLYNMACFFSLAGEIDDAIGYLRRAFEGLSGDATMKEWAMGDPDLKALRSDPRFAEILQSFRP
jgi:tetratricopeptide (TPR) repeat protein